MSRTVRFTAAIVITLCMIVCFGPGVVSAASKPAKVKIPSVKVSGNQASISYKKAKSAKKYKLQIQKNDKKWKNVKTVTIKGTSYKYTGAYGTKYRVRVQGVNGKKTGKWSVYKTFTIKKPVTHKEPVNYLTKLKKGERYTVKSPGGTSTHTGIVIDSEIGKNGFKYTMRTDDGGTLEVDHVNGYNDSYSYKKKNWDDYFSFTNMVEGKIVKILKSDTTFVWTLDDTEPMLGQKDYVGKSDKYARYNGQPVEMQLRGTFDQTGKKYVYEKELLDHHPSADWHKVYHGKTLIYENRGVSYDY